MINQVISLKYMLWGYAFILCTLLVYIYYLIQRWRKLQKEYKSLEESEIGDS